jgi:hypothetical protein
MIYEHSFENLIIKKKVVFKVYTTSRGKQDARFKAAAARARTNLGHRFDIEIHYLTVENVRVQRMSEAQFIDYFLDCDFHVFLTHIGQGQVNRHHLQEPHRENPWNMEVLLEELKRLKGHTGFPFKNFLYCPAFTQDKYMYLFLLREYTIPTLRISLTLCEGDIRIPTTVRDEIRSFMDRHSLGEGDEPCKFVFKLPFTTNGQAIDYPTTYEEVLEAIQHMFNRFKGKIHYGLLQPCLKNRKEYKICFSNGQFLHENFEPNSPAGSKAFGTSDERKAFAEEIMNALKVRVPGLLYAPLMRIDVMYYAGEMVLNEVESLEAVSWGPDEHKLDSDTDSFWLDFIVYAIRCCI